MKVFAEENEGASSDEYLELSDNNDSLEDKA